MDSRSDEDIRRGVVQFLGAWSPRTPPDEVLDIWVAKLRQHWGKPELSAAMNTLTTTHSGNYPPSIPEVLARMHHNAHGMGTKRAAWEGLTDEQRKRAKHAAMLSALWLHYEFGWDLEKHPGFEAFGPNVRAAAQAAKEQYPRARIRLWMANQAANDPLPCDRSISRQLS